MNKIIKSLVIAIFMFGMVLNLHSYKTTDSGDEGASKDSGARSAILKGGTSNLKGVNLTGEGGFSSDALGAGGGGEGTGSGSGDGTEVTEGEGETGNPSNYNGGLNCADPEAQNSKHTFTFLGELKSQSYTTTKIKSKAKQFIVNELCGGQEDNCTQVNLDFFNLDKAKIGKYNVNNPDIVKKSLYCTEDMQGKAGVYLAYDSKSGNGPGATFDTLMFFYIGCCKDKSQSFTSNTMVRQKLIGESGDGFLWVKHGNGNALENHYESKAYGDYTDTCDGNRGRNDEYSCSKVMNRCVDLKNWGGIGLDRRKGRMLSCKPKNPSFYPDWHPMGK